MICNFIMELLNGCKLQNGEYRIEKKIGQGGFGITYLARWYKEVQGAIGSANIYSMVVIKEFFWSKYCNREADGCTVSISSAEGKEMMTQFKEKLKKEGKIISRLSHPNIVGILNIFEENNTAYLVMQFIEGESLGEIIKKRGKIDETTALRYAKQICSALIEIHSKWILHLDIKPSNILINENNNALIIDFGISKQYDKTAQETSSTPIGVSVGYSPMEQYGTVKSFSPPTDIYALGATLYKMLTGETPLEATYRNQFDLAPVRHLNPNVSKKTEEAITKAMNEKIRDRYQTVQEFWHALRKDNKLHPPMNDRKSTIAASPKDKIIIIRDDKIENKPESLKVRKQPAQRLIIKPAPESTNSRKKVLHGVVGGITIIAVFAVLFYLYDAPPTHLPSIHSPVVQTVSNGSKELKKPDIQNEHVMQFEAEKLRREKEEKDRQVAILLQQADNSFNNKNLGSARFELSFQLYMKAKNLGGDASAGYNHFFSMAQRLIKNGSGFDTDVKMMLQYAQRLKDTQEVRILLVKCRKH